VSEEWISAERACAALGVGYMTLVRWVDDGTLVAEGADGGFLFRRSDIEHLAAHRPPTPPRKLARRPSKSEAVEAPTAPTEPPEPGPSDEELEKALLLGRFVVAFERGQPGPCPVCGEVLRPKAWPAHLLNHK
jgi:excisionase family DNA binding protein